MLHRHTFMQCRLESPYWNENFITKTRRGAGGSEQVQSSGDSIGPRRCACLPLSSSKNRRAIASKASEAQGFDMAEIHTEPNHCVSNHLFFAFGLQRTCATIFGYGVVAWASADGVLFLVSGRYQAEIRTALRRGRTGG